MSTDQLVDEVLKKVPNADRATVLDLIVACDADIVKVLGLLGFQSQGSKRQSTLSSLLKSPRPSSPGTRVFKAKVAKTTTQKGFSSPQNVVAPANTIRKNAEIIYLHTPEQVEAAGIYCTLHRPVLDSSLANQLLTQLLADSKSWTGGKFYLFDRLVESPHTSAIYADKKDATANGYSTYQGKTIRNARPFSPQMATARAVVEQLVNSELQKRPPARHNPSNTWKSQFAIANHYRDKTQSVGYHSDQLSNLGPEPIIAGLSLGCSREFRLRTRQPSDNPIYAIVLPHNSLVIMHAGCQENFKHSIVPVKNVEPMPLAGTSRISITYRYYRPEFAYQNVPLCNCKKPMILRSTLADRYKYIWQCGQNYQNNGGCGLVKEANFDHLAAAQ